MKYDFFFFSSRRRHTRCLSDWSSDVCSSDLKHHTGGASDRNADGRGDQPAVTTDAIADDRPAVLVGDIEKALIGIEGKKARRAAKRRYPLPRRKRDLVRIEDEHTDDVLSAIGKLD